MRSQDTSSAVSRVGALRLLLLAGLIVLAARAGQLSTVNPDAVDQGLRQIHTRIELPGERGLILDRTARELAISIDAPSVYVFPKLLENRRAAARALAKALSADPAGLERRIAAHDGFTYLARWIEPEQADRVQALALPGVGIQYEPRRTYPARRMAAPLIGFADIDGQGVRGVEQMMDDWLRGKPRTLAVERDARGRLLSNETVDHRVMAGGDIALTLDAGLQAQAEALLVEAVEGSEASGGIVICIDPATGDVLTLAEAPGFDPNDFRNTPFVDTRSRSFHDALEPGSTMKAFLVAAALEAGAIRPETRIDTVDGWVRVPGKTIRDHHPYGVIDPTGVLRFSSNVGAVWIAEQLGAERYHDALLRFGFSRSTKSGFPHESAGLLRPWSKWKPVDQANVAFGQGLNITPMQLAMATAALANGGLLMQPRLVMAKRKPMGDWQELSTKRVGRVLGEDTARRVAAMLESVTGEEGTGRLAGLAGVRVAGKTGTAQLLDKQTGRYSDTRYTAWFAGFAPAEAPRVAIVVALDEPKGRLHTGGAVAAPLFAEVAATQLAHHGILTRPEPVPAAKVPSWVAVQERIDARRQAEAEAKAKAQRSEAQQLARAAKARPAREARASRARNARSRTTAAAPPAPAVSAGPRQVTELPDRPARPVAASLQSDTVLVPDFRGESLSGARRLADRESLEVLIHGSHRGHVIGQSPAAGTIMEGSDRIIILSFSVAREEG